VQQDEAGAAGGKRVYNIADPFKLEPLTARRGVTVSDEKFGADAALRILEDSKKMYQEDRAAKAQGARA
jgi:hypothetical protein